MSSLTSSADLAPVIPGRGYQDSAREPEKKSLTHGGTKTAIDLEHGELAEHRVILGLRKGVVCDNLVGARRLDAVPIAGIGGKYQGAYISAIVRRSEERHIRVISNRGSVSQVRAARSVLEEIELRLMRTMT